MVKSRLWKVIVVAVTAVGVMGIHARRSNATLRRQARVVEMSRLNWIGYAPTGYDPRHSRFPTRESIRADLSTLKAVGFQGVITYESTGPLAQIPIVAKELGLLVIQGVWGPADRDELEAAIGLEPLVAGYCVGNEGLGSRYSISELDQGVTYLANRVDVPVAVSEQIHVYFQNPELVEIGDWLFPIVHPHFGDAKRVADALAWIESNTSRLRNLAVGRHLERPLFIKEIGMPSAGDAAYSEPEQAEFFSLLWRREGLAFAVFEAFDRRGWQYVSAVEPYWGFFREDRSPKPAVRAFTDRITRSRQAR